MSNGPRHKGIGKVSGRQRVTMHDIARVAGCSQPTVSVVLNGNDAVKISDDMRARVLKAARDLGYRTASTAPKSTTGTRSGPIAFVIDTLATSPEGVNAFDGVMQAVKSAGNIVLLAETRNDPELERKTLEFFVEMNVAAIIYACVFTRQIEPPDQLMQTDIPVYLLNCHTDDLSLPAVIPGEIAGGHSATNALLMAGHTRIGIITGELFMEGAGGRLQGYRNALASADLPFSEELVVEGNWLPSSGYEGSKTLMALANPPTAIFCQNDRMAIGCYEALKELGLSIPDDVSVIGYDDDETARHLSPPLTSMNLADRSMGRWVIEQLFNGPEGASQRHPVTKLECELVERESIGPVRRSEQRAVI